MDGRLPAWFGVELLKVEHGAVDARMALQPQHLAPNNFLHAATVIAIADSSCGMGCIASLPKEAGGFTTIELKTNFLGTATEGALRCEARMVHGGRRTQIWDATVSREEDERVIALFRCTQFILPADDPRTEEQRQRRKEFE
jgi:1,4-dihydroxy-2-naphthoyl-CoA hydrolase